MYTPEDFNFFLDLRFGCDMAAFTISGWSFLSNFALMVVFFCMKRHKKKFIPNLIIFTQAFVGILIATYAVLSTLPNYLEVWWVQERYYNIARIVLEDYSIFLYLGILTIGTVERLLAFYKPFLHFRLVSLSKCMLCVTIACMVSFVPCAVLMFYTKPEGHIDTNEFYVIYGSVRMVTVLVGTVLLLLLLILSYYKQTKHARNAAKRSSLTKKMNSLSRRLRNETSWGSSEGREWEMDNGVKDVRSLIVLIVMTAVLAFSYLPLGVLSVMRNITSQVLSFYDLLIVEMVVFLLYISSASINPLLVFCLQNDYREQLYSVFCCCRGCCRGYCRGCGRSCCRGCGRGCCVGCLRSYCGCACQCCCCCCCGCRLRLSSS